MRRRSLMLTPLAMAASAPSRAQAAADAASWPARPVRLVVPFPPGSAADTVGRRASERLTTALGQPVVVENRAGAGGTLGTDLVAKAPPDGHMLGQGGIAQHAIGPAVYRTVSYDPVRDFTHVALLSEFPLSIGVSADGPIRGLADLLDAARRRTGGVRVGTPGNGTATHVSLELLRRVSGGELVHVPFRGPAPAVVETLAGRIEAMMGSFSEVVGNERLRPLAVALPERLGGWPEVPTFREHGVDLVATVWYTLCGPAGLPEAVAERLHHDVRAAVASAGYAVPGSVPDRRLGRAEVAAFVAAEVARWGEVVRAAGVRPD